MHNILLPAKKLSGWGRYPVEECFIAKPSTVMDVQMLLKKNKEIKNWIVYGLGRSYGDTPLNKNGGVIIFTKWNHFISFDVQSGILECEAGVSFNEILDIVVPRGYFLPVTPGTKFVTVGGAIANDVHGKNHHVDGTFSEFVKDFTLLTASGEIVRCSRSENSELFWATIGGLGLTGIILTVRFQLIPIETTYIDVHYQRAKNLDEALLLFNQSDEKYQYSVAWIDCLAKGSSLGRCVLMRGNHAKLEQVDLKQRKMQTQNKNKISIPFDFPSFALNSFSIKAFNAIYYNIHPKNEKKIVDYEKFFYPLDSILHWNRMYGKRGFIQYQVVFPLESCQAGLTKMLERLSESKRSSFLAVLKSSGDENQGLLSFPKRGFTLALDIPYDDSLFDFLKSLDELVISYGGRVYLAKDSTLSPEHFKVMYPKVNEFRRIKEKIDPNHLFSSSMARRLGILED